MGREIKFRAWHTERASLLLTLKRKIEEGTFDHTPPVQPDIKPGDRVRHETLGVGIVLTVVYPSDNGAIKILGSVTCRFNHEVENVDYSELEVIKDEPNT